LENGKEEQTETKQNKRRSIRQSKVIPKPSNVFFNGIPGINPKTGKSETYFLGVIDCLTDFHIWKLAAHTFKRILWEKEMLSTVPPDYYADRFFQFCSKTIWSQNESDSTDLFYIELQSPII